MKKITLSKISLLLLVLSLIVNWYFYNKVEQLNIDLKEKDITIEMIKQKSIGHIFYEKFIKDKENKDVETKWKSPRILRGREKNFCNVNGSYFCSVCFWLRWHKRRY